MYNSTKLSDSPRPPRKNNNTILNETANGTLGRSFIQPKITSTPLHSTSLLHRRDSMYATPPKQHLSSPKRYSLSEIATPPRYLNKRVGNRSSFTQSAAGPLLGSTPYHVNVSTYMDAKSPGLAGRAVQYNEEKEQQRSQATHQQKYGSPGLFPIVHLFKKELPTRNLTPKRVTVRIASPEYTRHNSQEYNRMLMEGIVRPNSSKRGLSSPKMNDSTRSVLDALKEISRKRIHASEDFDVNEEPGKRIRTDCFNSKDSNKRYRDDSLLENSTSPVNQMSKRVCVYDEYAASCSSMNFSFKQLNHTPKRKSLSSITENPKESKQVKLISVETQTNTSNEATALGSKEILKVIPEEVDHNTENQKFKEKKDSPIKIFDDTPLERIRKNRLSTLMGTLASKDAILSPKPNINQILTEEPATKPPQVETTEKLLDKSVDKPLISILSSPKKVSPKSDKHVTFNLPENSSSCSLNVVSSNVEVTQPSSQTAFAASSSTNITSAPLGPNFGFGSNASATNLSDKLVAPTPPASPVMFEKPPQSDIPKLPEISSTASTTAFVLSKQASVESTISVASSKSSITDLFGASTPSIIPTTTIQTQNVIPALSGSFASSASPILSFGGSQAPKISFASSTSLTANASISPPKPGGFKFDLAKPTATVAQTPAAVLSTNLFSSANSDAGKLEGTASKPLFSGASTIANATTASVAPSFSHNNSFTFGGGTKPTDLSPVTSNTTLNPPSFAAGGASASFGGTSSGLSSFSTPTVTAPAPAVGAFGASNMSFKFGGNTTTSTENKPVFNLASSATPSFGAATNTVTPSFNTSVTTSGFGSSNTSSPKPTFGVSSNTLAPASTAAPPAYSSPSAGFGVKSPSFAFGANSTSTTTNSMGGATFGNNVPVSTTVPMFGGSNKSTFGATAPAAAPPFQNGTSSFGTTTVSPFNAPNNNSTAAAFGQSNVAQSSFAPAATTTVAPFGASSATPTFGAPTTSVSFGGTATTSVGFGTKNPAPSPAFGTAAATTTSSMFGTGSTNASSSAISAGFGAKPSTGFGSASNIFGASSNTPAAATFASNTKPMFGATTAAVVAPFGATSAKTTAASSFGSPSSPAFGVTNNSFGGTKTTGGTFGNASAFGTTTTAGNSFGTTTTPAYGTSNSFGGTATSGFGTNNSFGSNRTASFGGATAASSFGSNTSSVFGAGNNAPTPGFGANTNAFPAATNNATGGFGSSNNIANSSFGSGFAANANTSAFAKTAPPTNTFGAASTNNSFGASQVPAATTQSGGVFSFGGTTSSAQPPKPAGVFSFGSAAEAPKPSFNFSGGASAAPPSFGGSTSAFGASAAGFGTAGAVPFNSAVNATPGTFSIGAGAPSARSRTQLKAKRRT